MRRLILVAAAAFLAGRATRPVHPLTVDHDAEPDPDQYVPRRPAPTLNKGLRRLASAGMSS